MNIYKVMISPKNLSMDLITVGTYKAESSSDAIQAAIVDIRRSRSSFPVGNLIATKESDMSAKKSIMRRNPHRSWKVGDILQTGGSGIQNKYEIVEKRSDGFVLRNEVTKRDMLLEPEYFHYFIKSNRGAHSNPKKLKWYLGLTKDFRRWEVFDTSVDPRISGRHSEYVWFHGPFKSGSRALAFKRAENLKQ